MRYCSKLRELEFHSLNCLLSWSMTSLSSLPRTSSVQWLWSSSDCGNHLSQDAANKLQRDGKPCTMCKQPQLATMPDKYMKWRVNNLRVQIMFLQREWVWVGGWSVQSGKSYPESIKYPVVFPNSCEIGTVPHGEMKEHLKVCPLQPVACEYAEAGRYVWPATWRRHNNNICWVQLLSTFNWHQRTW